MTYDMILYYVNFKYFVPVLDYIITIINFQHLWAGVQLHLVTELHFEPHIKAEIIFTRIRISIR
jgi:hypothetical protein